MVAEVRPLLESLANARDIAMPENTQASGEKSLLPPVALDVLIRQKGDQRLRHCQTLARFIRAGWHHRDRPSDSPAAAPTRPGRRPMICSSMNFEDSLARSSHANTHAVAMPSKPRSCSVPKN